ncbi:MAG TPA: hypothetical protein VLT36_01655 [Candidatus Dormibacteraeota bacterium]|nr:hypothetical protein [Candidatus Dormibacteraeota bacterium]
MKFSIFLAVPLLALAAGCAHDKSAHPAQVQVSSPHELDGYREPLSTPGYRFASLPLPVRNTVLAEAGMAEVIDVIKEVRDGRLIYKIYFRNAVNNPPLFVGADGSVLNKSYGVTVPAPPPSILMEYSDLPPDVAKMVKERAPESEVATVVREPWGSQTVYIVSFRSENRYPRMYIVSDGTTVSPVH